MTAQRGEVAAPKRSRAQQRPHAAHAIPSRAPDRATEPTWRQLEGQLRCASQPARHTARYERHGSSCAPRQLPERSGAAAASQPKPRQRQRCSRPQLAGGGGAAWRQQLGSPRPGHAAGAGGNALRTCTPSTAHHQLRCSRAISDCTRPPLSPAAVPPQVCAVAAPPSASAATSAGAMRVVEVDLGDRTYPIYIGRGAKGGAGRQEGVPLKGPLQGSSSVLGMARPNRLCAVVC